MDAHNDGIREGNSEGTSSPSPFKALEQQKFVPSKTTPPDLGNQSKKEGPTAQASQNIPGSVDFQGDQKPITPAVNSYGLKTLRTYEGDLADAINQKKASVIKITIAENKKNAPHETIVNKSPTTSKNTSLFLVSTLFILLGAGVLYYVYTFVLPHPLKPEQIVKTEPTLITTDTKKEIEVTQNNLAQKVHAEVNDVKLPRSIVENIVFMEATSTGNVPLSASAFLTQIGSGAPSAFIRTLSGEYMFGVHSLDQSEPFLILKTNSYETAYASMLKWEPTMYENLKSSIIRTNIDATTSPQTSSDILDAKTIATDMVIRNKDVRVLKDLNNQTLLLYSFLDKDTIVITTNELTLREIVDRLDKKVYVR